MYRRNFLILSSFYSPVCEREIPSQRTITKITTLNVAKMLKTAPVEWQCKHSFGILRHTHTRAHTRAHERTRGYVTMSHNLQPHSRRHTDAHVQSYKQWLDMGAFAFAFDKFRIGFPQNVSKFKAFVRRPANNAKLSIHLEFFLTISCEMFQYLPSTCTHTHIHWRCAVSVDIRYCDKALRNLRFECLILIFDCGLKCKSTNGISYSQHAP